MATMLALIQQATAEMGLAVPSVVAGNTANDQIQQLGLLNALGYELQSQHSWQALNKAYITTVVYSTITGNTTINSSTISGIPSTAGLDTTYAISGTGINQATYITAVPAGGTTLTISQPATSTNTGKTYTLTKAKYAMPSDYDRPIDETHWDKSKHWKMLGPETAQQWEWLISGYISTGPRIRYRIFGSYFQIWPMISTSEVIGFEYVTNTWAADSTGTAKTSLTVDTDTCIFRDRLMVLGLKHKYFQAKGFGDIFLSDYQRELDIAKASDAGSPTLSMNPIPTNILITWNNIPDSGFGI